jgi:hypothetical protein
MKGISYSYTFILSRCNQLLVCWFYYSSSLIFVLLSVHLASSLLVMLHLGIPLFHHSRRKHFFFLFGV